MLALRKATPKMPDQERVYKIRLPDGAYRLVTAASRRKAINHVADSLLKVSVATIDDLNAGRKERIEVEYPGWQEIVESSESPAN
jgi:hypothetical protein